jgi:uncharacterized protein (TIGR02246 family)
MKRISVFVALGFLVGLGTGFFAGSAGVDRVLRKDSHAIDLEAIEKLHQKDIEVTLPQDPKGLLDIFTEDAVRIVPGSPPAVGKRAIEAENAKGRADYPGFKVLSYVPEYRNIHIENGWACEWGEHEGKYKVTPEGPPVTMRLKGFDVLRKQSDGSWKFAVLILNE